jgi:hypothetical protein
MTSFLFSQAPGDRVRMYTIADQSKELKMSSLEYKNNNQEGGYLDLAIVSSSRKQMSLIWCTINFY